MIERMTQDELPEGWVQAPLSDVVDVLDSKRIPLNSDEREQRIRGKRQSDLVPYYGATGQVGFIDEPLFNEPLILLGEDGVPFLDPLKHKAYRVSGKSWVNNHAHVLRARSSVSDERFITGFLNSFDYTGYVTGSTRLKLTQGSMNSIPVRLAPLAEQKRIADKLEAVLGRVDACRARLDRVPDLLKRFRQSVLAAATTGQLTEDWREKHPRHRNADSLAALIRKSHADAGGHKAGNAAPPSEDIHDLTTDMFPNGWQVLTLREAVSPDRPITYGILMPGPELKEGVPYVRVADFPNDRLNLTTIRNTSLAMDEQFKRSRLRTGDLLMSIRGTVGRMVVVPPELEAANITQDTARLSIQPEISSTFVLWYLRSPMAQTRMRAATKGVAVRGMNIGDIRALQLPLPSFAEQAEIVRRVEALLALADRIEARLTAARAQVERLTPATLSKAFRGDLVPQDPNDEPAAKLLKRLSGMAGAVVKPKAKGRSSKVQ